MSLDELLRDGRLEQRATSRNEILDLLRLASRDLSDAAVSSVSTDGRFNHAYEAGLILATIPLRCAGYRTKGEAHHSTVFEALPFVMGNQVEEMAEYLQTCRRKRNGSAYFAPEVATEGEVSELTAEVDEFGETVRRWIRDNYPQCC